MYEIEKKEVDVVVWQTLRILKEGILSLGGRNIARVSIVLPFLSKFLVFIFLEVEGDEDDPIYIRNFKTKLKNEMVVRCRENLNTEPLALSSFCDMRYSQQLSQVSWCLSVIWSVWSNQRNCFCQVPGRNGDEEIGLETSLQPKPKRDKKSFFDDDEDDEDQGDQSVKNQFESYLKEIYIKPKECPGAWWRLNKDKSWHW